MYKYNEGYHERITMDKKWMRIMKRDAVMDGVESDAEIKRA